jgi:hypothetical protein
MSFNFGDSNVYIVPPKGVLKFYDLYRWQLTFMDIHRTRIMLDKGVEDELERDLSDYLGSNGWGEVRAYSKRHGERLRSFFKGVEYGSLGVGGQGQDADQAQISFWAYVTDHPAESFKRRHYLPHPPELPTDVTSIPVGVRFFEGLKRNREAIWDSKTYPGRMEIPSGGLTSRPIGEEELLPIWGEYCGYFGRSKRGNVVSYTYIGKVADESMCATPLYRSGRNNYYTLYFVSPPRHIDYPVSPHPRAIEEVSMNLYGEDRRNVLHLLEEDGFPVTTRFKNKAYALRRGGDVLHYYPSPKSCEPFLIVASHRGSFDPRGREELLSAIGERCFNRSRGKVSHIRGMAAV